jgi:hypothetical protein|nr:MAG TPA: hypothetical protein [Caudoviricetes sp.]
MKEKLLALLQTKFAGVDNAILDRIATKKSENVTDEAQLPTIAEGIGFQDVLTSYGDYRAGDAQQTAVKNYEKRHNLKDGKPIEQPGIGDTQGKENPDIQALIDAAIAEKVTPLQEKVAAYEAEKTATERLEMIGNKAKELGIPEWRVKEGFAISDGMDEVAITNYLTGIKQNITTAGLEGKSGFPLAATGEATKEEADAIVAGMRI